MSVDWALLRHEVTMTGAPTPYSGCWWARGLTDDGRLVRGCNVENASYGLTLCAECGLVSDLAASGGGAWWPWRWRATGARWPRGCARPAPVRARRGDLLLDGEYGPVFGELLPAAFGPEDAARAGR